MPCVYGLGDEGQPGGYNTRGSLASGSQAEGSEHQGAGSFNPMTGAGEAPGYDNRGVLPFTRALRAALAAGRARSTTAPYGETTIGYTYGDTSGNIPCLVPTLCVGNAWGDVRVASTARSHASTRGEVPLHQTLRVYNRGGAQEDIDNRQPIGVKR